MEASFFKPFVEATLLTLKVQCSHEAKPGKPFYKGQKPNLNIGIAGFVGIVSSKFNGTLGICFPKEMFLTLMNNMLGEKYQEITKDLEDGAAELLNIIFGHAKRVLNAQGNDLQMAIPTIIRGEGIDVKHFTDSPVVVLPFISDSGEFQVEISTERLKNL